MHVRAFLPRALGAHTATCCLLVPPSCAPHGLAARKGASSSGSDGGAGASSGRRAAGIDRLMRMGLGVAGTAVLLEMSGAGVRSAPVPRPITPADEQPAQVQAAKPALGAGAGAGANGLPAAGAGAPHDPVSSLFNLDDPRALEELGTQLSIGSVAGFCSGYAIKKVSKVAAVAVGTGFVLLQLLRYNGYIKEMDWAKVEDHMVRALDADGDGKVTITDARLHFDKAVKVLGFSLPSGSAFVAAFLLGLRWG
ncbi:hypothetical protein EON68_02695 [archaeon]|nr:MAG: hypothetical protein EON68_02695 [archaeon]